MTQLQDFLLNNFNIPPNTQTDGCIQLLDLYVPYSDDDRIEILFRGHYRLYNHHTQLIADIPLDKVFHLHDLMEKLVEHDLSTCLNVCESFQDDCKESFALAQEVLKDSLEYFIKDWKKLYCLKHKVFPFEVWDKIIEFSGLEDEFQNSQSQFYMNLIRAFVVELSYLNLDHVKFSHLTNDLHYPTSLTTALSYISEINSRVFRQNISDEDLHSGPINSKHTLVGNYLLCLPIIYNITNTGANNVHVLRPLNPYYEDEEISRFQETLLLKTTNLLGKIKECDKIVNSNPKDFLNFRNLWSELNEKNMIHINILRLPEQLQNFYKNTYKSAYYENLISTREFIDGFIEWFNSSNKVQLRNNIAPAVNTQENQQDDVIEEEGLVQGCEATSSNTTVVNKQTHEVEISAIALTDALKEPLSSESSVPNIEILYKKEAEVNRLSEEVLNTEDQSNLGLNNLCDAQPEEHL